jgi:hypothetical protein
MTIPIVLDNLQRRMADSLNELLAQSIGKQRGIGRIGRSRLGLEAQAYQDLIDRILYRRAGPTDDDVKSLEKRLEGML